tara:strand:+ start:14 stop:424 length:411 start_codon:yes stop_codon:yes gene_type:complete
MSQPKVLYGDYSKRNQHLKTHLRNNGIEFEYLGEPDTSQFDVERVFNERYRSRVGGFRVIVAHMGVGFNGEIVAMLKESPQLRIALVSDLAITGDHPDFQDPDQYKEEWRERLECFDYKSKGLIDFVKEALEEPED